MKVFLFLTIAGFFTGCVTPSYTVRVDAIADEEFFGEKFIIKSGLKNVGDNDLRFREYSRIVSNALRHQGYKPVADIQKTDFIVMLSYGIGEPQTRSYTRQVPIYGQNNDQTTVVKNSWGQQIGSLETKPSNPYAPTGYQSITEEYTTYDRYVLMTAYNVTDALKPRAEGEKLDPQMAWEAKIVSSGSSGDLRKVFPAMILGATPYFGENSGEQQIVEVRIDFEEDPQARVILYGKPSNSNRKPASQGR